MSKKQLKNFSGQMLIEVVVAIGIIALVLVGVSDLMTKSLSVITYQRQRDEALNILQKIQNGYKAMRDTDAEAFFNTVANTIIDPCEAGKNYKCTVLVDKQLNSVLITVTAEWSDGGKTYNLSLSQSLFKTAK